MSRHFQGNTSLKEKIVEKLKEFDAYIADELPAYILVMLDNKKPWSDINQELEVFLVESTEPFVDWLKQEITALSTPAAAKTKPQESENTQKSSSPKVIGVESEQVSVAVKERTVEKPPPPLKPADEVNITPAISATGKATALKRDQRRERSRSPHARRDSGRSRSSLDRYDAGSRRRRSRRSPSPQRQQRRSTEGRGKTARSGENEKKTTTEEKSEVVQNPVLRTSLSRGGEDEDTVPIYAEDEFKNENGSGDEDNLENEEREDARELLNSRRITSKVVKVSEKERPRMSSNSLLLKKAIAGVHDESSPHPRSKPTRRSTSHDTTEQSSSHHHGDDEMQPSSTSRKENDSDADLRTLIARKREKRRYRSPDDVKKRRDSHETHQKDVSSVDDRHRVADSHHVDRHHVDDRRLVVDHHRVDDRNRVDDRRLVVDSHRIDDRNRVDDRHLVKDRHHVDDQVTVTSKTSIKRGIDGSVNLEGWVKGHDKLEGDKPVHSTSQGVEADTKSTVKRPRLVMTESGLMTYKSLVKSGVIIDEDYATRDDDDETEEALHKGMLDLSKSQEVTSSQEEETVSGSGLQHPLERCRFWPNCKNGDSCTYHHPTVPCKLFPDCRFGAKCLFIHPTCKFNARCTKPDCPYLHTVSRAKVGTPYHSGMMMSPGFPSPIPIPISYPRRGRGKVQLGDSTQFKWMPGKTPQVSTATQGVHISERKFAPTEKPESFPVP